MVPDLTKIEYLGLDRVLKRGTGRIMEEGERSALVYDGVSGAVMLACEDRAEGRALLSRHVGDECRLLMVSDPELGREAFAKYGFSERLICRQTAYYGRRPENGRETDLRIATEDDLPLLTSVYDLVSPEELALIVRGKNLMLCTENGRTVGFIGEHLEGSMGLLYVFPEFRRKGYAEALERAFIARTMDRGFIPFGQVEVGNTASFALQRKIGMTVSDDPICWMWR